MLAHENTSTRVRICPQRREQLLSKMLFQQAKGAMRLGEYELALNCLERLIDIEPKQAKHYSNRGIVHQYQRQWAAAIAAHNQALALDRTLESAYINRAKCYTAQGDWFSAINDYDRAIDINPTGISARILQGMLFRQIRAYEDAIVCFELGMAFEPGHPRLYAERGRTHHLRGHWNWAMGDYRRAMELLKSLNCDRTSPKIAGLIATWVHELNAA